jgi:hypothetical protein
MLFNPGVSPLPETLSLDGKILEPVSKIIAAKKLSETIGTITPGMNLFIMCKSEWSTTDLLDYLLQQIPNADIKISTWAISIPAIRAIAEIKQRYLVNIKILCDRRVLKACFDAYQLAQELGIEIGFSRIHAKLITVQSPKFNITVLSSANLSRNPRWEAACLIESKEITNAFSNQITALWT